MNKKTLIFLLSAIFFASFVLSFWLWPRQTLWPSKIISPVAPTPAPTSPAASKFVTYPLPVNIIPADQWSAYKSDKGKFTVKYLPDWTVTENSDQNQISVTFASKDLTRSTAFKPDLGGQITIVVQDAAAEQQAEARQELDTFSQDQNTASQSASQLGGQKAIQFSQITGNDLTIYTLRGSQFVTLSLSAEDKRLDDFKKVYEITRQSFQFLP